MALSWPFKDPDEVLDYSIDWSGRIGTDDTILTAAWTVPAGITNHAESHTDSVTTLWLAGGTLGAAYSILNRIVTAGGRTLDQTVSIKVKSK